MNENRRKSSASVELLVLLEAGKLIGGGRALAHHGGSTWMIEGALPGESIRALPLRRRAGIVEATTVSVESAPHPARLAEPCPQAGLCGGCDWPHVGPAGGARLKSVVASEAARGFPELAELIASAPIWMSEDAYRLRARLHWDPERRRLGFYERRSRSVASIESCRVLTPGFPQALPLLESALGTSCPALVDLEWLEGTATDDVVAALRPAKGGPAEIEPEWVPAKATLGSKVRGFHSIHKSGQQQVGWGASEVVIELPIPLTVPIGAFFQGNRHLILPLFKRVAELVGGEPTPVYDLHAGVGYLAAAARFAGDRPLTLVEPNTTAAHAARRNLPGSKVVVGATAEEFVGGSRTLERDVIVITDPPRTGLSRTLREHLADWLPGRILMLGCDPATWARDAGFLGIYGYQVRVVELFDLFPSTHHVEILALLERP